RLWSPHSNCYGAYRLAVASAALVVVLEAHNVVFAEIAAALHLDQLERDPPRIGEAMHGADRDVDGFVLVHSANLLADRHLGGAAHHDPMLGAVHVLLQRQLAARIHDDALDLEALARVDRLVVPPWPIAAAVVADLVAALCPHVRDQRLDVLGAVSGKD